MELRQRIGTLADIDYKYVIEQFDCCQGEWQSL